MLHIFYKSYSQGIPFFPITLKCFIFHILVFILGLLFLIGCSLSIGLEIFSCFWFRSIIIVLLKHWQYRITLNHALIFTFKIVNESGSAVWILLNAQNKLWLKWGKAKINWLMHMQIIVFVSLLLLWFLWWCILNCLRSRRFKAKFSMYKWASITTTGVQLSELSQRHLHETPRTCLLEYKACSRM